MVATLINTSLTPQGIHDGGWRIPFLLGGVFGLVAMYLRRWLQETPDIPRDAAAQSISPGAAG
ncbi:alpha-ketoglutarate transporter [Raoultella terrigena]|uniref:Alpha-ketoglutarate transporter n=1 Tax=Raoultella terrigena TaxID=577 RepID=A0A4V6YW61_RAOTE|nr:alpha-ketoglutarate transporter [Raoultella terrigena]